MCVPCHPRVRAAGFRPRERTLQGLAGLTRCVILPTGFICSRLSQTETLKHKTEQLCIRVWSKDAHSNIKSETEEQYLVRAHVNHRSPSLYIAVRFYLEMFFYFFLCVFPSLLLLQLERLRSSPGSCTTASITPTR